VNGGSPLTGLSVPTQLHHSIEVASVLRFLMNEGLDLSANGRLFPDRVHLVEPGHNLRLRTPAVEIAALFRSENVDAYLENDFRVVRRGAILSTQRAQPEASRQHQRKGQNPDGSSVPLDRCGTVQESILVCEGTGDVTP
jgi:hypothetical protein